MEIYIVRHAIAEERNAVSWPDDAERPLSERGKRRFARAARGLRAIVPPVDAVLTSPYRRAKETAAILNSAAGWPQADLCEALAPNIEPAQTVDALQTLAPVHRLALVGHEPHLSGLAAYLLTGSPREATFAFRKGGVAALESSIPLAGGQAELRWLLPPRILRALAPASPRIR